MIIKSVQVRNFRSLLDSTLNCGNLTALLGANGVGKSAFLRALDLFYSSTAAVTDEDFYDRDSTKEISIRVTFNSLSKEAKELFAKYLERNTLSVEKVFRSSNGRSSASYHGATLQAPVFSEIREALKLPDRAVKAKGLHDSVRAQPGFADLPVWTTKGEEEEHLRAWEEANPDKCVRRRDGGQFFGFRQVGEGYLGQFTRLLSVPAVRDAAADAVEGRGSVFTDLMDLVVRSVLATRQAVKDLQSDLQSRYEEIMSPENLPELGGLANSMTGTLQAFVPGATVDLKWLALQSIALPMPKADVQLVEDGYTAPVSQCGHGLQRAFILTALQHLVLAQTAQEVREEEEEARPEKAAPAPAAKLPDLVLSIEEPELYQHPSRQRHFSTILHSLAVGKTPGVADRTQVLFCSHSPLLVSADRVDNVRLLRKVVHEERRPKVTKIISASLQDVANALWENEGKPDPRFSAESVEARLHTLMTPGLNEGFFAELVVLVEGPDDVAAIRGAALSVGLDPDAIGIAVIPCAGKTNLDRPRIMFSLLGIPSFLVWDSDKGKKDANPKVNRKLLRLLGEPEEDWPSQVGEQFACFEVDLETTLSTEIGGDLFHQLLQEAQATLAIPKKKHAIKNPLVISSILREARETGRTSGTLERIIEQILELARG